MHRRKSRIHAWRKKSGTSYPTFSCIPPSANSHSIRTSFHIFYFCAEYGKYHFNKNDNAKLPSNDGKLYSARWKLKDARRCAMRLWWDCFRFHRWIFMSAMLLCIAASKGFFSLSIVNARSEAARAWQRHSVKHLIRKCCVCIQSKFESFLPFFLIYAFSHFVSNRMSYKFFSNHSDTNPAQFSKETHPLPLTHPYEKSEWEY